MVKSRQIVRNIPKRHEKRGQPPPPPRPERTRQRPPAPAPRPRKDDTARPDGD